MQCVNELIRQKVGVSELITADLTLTHSRFGLNLAARYFGWSESEKTFQLLNALTDSAELILKEVGPAGTLERSLEWLQVRFGNKLRLEHLPC